MIRRIMDNPTLPRGTLVSAASSFWLPMPFISVRTVFGATRIYDYISNIKDDYGQGLTNKKMNF